MKSILPLLLLSLTLLLSGCASKSELPEGDTGTVTGKVTFGDQNLPEGSSIVFMPHEIPSGAGFPASGEIEPDGSFQLKMKEGTDILIGTYKVMITPPPPPEMTPEEAMQASREGRSTAPPEYPAIPKNVTDPNTSGKTFTVKKGENELIWDLKQ